MIEMDADLSHDPAALPELVAAVEQGCRSRHRLPLRGRRTIPDWKWVRRAISRGGCCTRAPCSVSRCTTSPAGYRAYHRDQVGARRARPPSEPTATASRWR